MATNLADTAPESRTLDANQPWPGLRPYTEDGEGFFHGRSDEIAELFYRVQSRVLTVLFGQSGIGKTSLLRAGLFPTLRQESMWPIYVRIDYDGDPIEQIKDAIRAGLPKT